MGLSPGVIAFGDVVMYFSHCNHPMTSTPISAPSHTVSGLLALDMLGLRFPRVASAEAARAIGRLKNCRVLRLAFTLSSGVIPYSCACACTESAPPARQTP